MISYEKSDLHNQEVKNLTQILVFKLVDVHYIFGILFRFKLLIFLYHFTNTGWVLHAIAQYIQNEMLASNHYIHEFVR